MPFLRTLKDWGGGDLVTAALGLQIDSAKMRWVEEGKVEQESGESV